MMRTPNGLGLAGSLLADRMNGKPRPFQGRGKFFKLLFATSVVCLSLSRLGLGRILRRS